MKYAALWTVALSAVLSVSLAQAAPIELKVQVFPEPGTIYLVALALIALVVTTRRKK